MKLAEARALCPEAEVAPTRHVLHHQAHEDLLETLSTFSDKVEGEGDGTLPPKTKRSPARFGPPSDGAALAYLDLGRLRMDEGADLAARIQRTVLEKRGYRSALGIGVGRFPARVAALSVPAGGALMVGKAVTPGFLAPFPVPLLPVDGETLRQLELLGLRKLGQIAGLPRPALADRFGKLGGLMHDLARGLDRARVAPYTPRQRITVSLAMEGGVSDRAVIEAALDRLAEELAGKLTEGGRVTRDLGLSLTLERGGVIERELALRAPAWSIPSLRQALGDLLGRMVVREAVLEVRARAAGIVPAQPRQLSLFEREAPDGAALQRLLVDLARRYGEEKFFWVRPADPHSFTPEGRYRWEGVSE
jgi:nucleotidyltransferase/DNA polymerase involved in DNA repair